MTSNVVPADDRSPVFFMSYAHRPNNAGDHQVKHFYDLVYSHVDELLGLPPGQDAGFIDAEMTGGQRWSDDLAYAIGHCQVLVPLVSPRYMSSEWCAREWNAFQARPVRTMDGGAPSSGELPVIPVWWTPAPLARLPKAVRDVQFFTAEGLYRPEMTRLYQREGLYGLLQLGGPGLEVYESVAWFLARRITDSYGIHDVQVADVDFTVLGTTFEGGVR
ncbi:TIR-like protein FxsC [Actinoplanes sp. HUAS TT8]|uniref:TIR-like protein FxsC n=1 Tax=Actinoplanes sp. HUAS TT8 TaxID=3447453 RepID=UPI003F527E09